MSRIGKKPIEIPSGVQIDIKDNKIMVSGPKGKLEIVHAYEVEIEKIDNAINIKKTQSSKRAAAMWGTTNRLVSNMIEGVTNGFEKKLELNGVGYRMAVKGNNLDLALGFSHPVQMAIPEGLAAVVEGNILTISGIDKQKVGQFSAEIRELKPVEPYKGKGFKYTGEMVRRKEGKKAASGE